MTGWVFVPGKPVPQGSSKAFVVKEASVMPNQKKATDDQLIEAYERLGSVRKVADEFSMVGQSVHERLVKLGANTPMNLFTVDDQNRLVADYVAYRAAGKVSDLAREMGRTIYFLSRQARVLGLTDAAHEKRWCGKWKYMSDGAARMLFDSFKASSYTLGQFCAKHGYDDEGLRMALRDRWPDEWDAVIESKAPVSSWYRLGRALEYRVRDHLKRDGYFVMRSPASKSPIDLVAVKAGQVLFIQCKRGGALPPAEWNAIYDLAVSTGAIPILAEQPFPRSLRYWRMIGRKDGSKRAQPRTLFEIDEVESAS